ncbi:MAG: aspartate ammonia-lyase [Chloroflexota bacterium]|nr:aspartate ammonia-lyase [Chloroflexota bacterium]MDE3192724.1 aspartate ammonia-lyase [Chloroflexota bacterium]
MTSSERIEKDTLGEVHVPADALYGAQTQRGVENYPISGYRAFPAFIRGIVAVKKAAALANAEAGRLTGERRDAIVWACDEILGGKHHDQFVIDAFQAGAGVSFHMNANEVIANLADRKLGGALGSYTKVGPNDHVNMAQSTNDVTPTAMRLAHLELTKDLAAELDRLADALAERSSELRDVVKPGRTHLQDAVPITFGQEIGGWAGRIRSAAARLRAARGELCELGIGGTAAGTGLNADPRFRERVCRHLAQWYGEPIVPAKDLFQAMQSMAPFVRVSSGMRTASIELIQLCNDIRLLVSGPRTGFGELVIPAVQPGSSIMPGKINPAIAEMVDQVCFQVVGNDTAVMLAAQAGQLELNVMMPEVNFAVCFSATILTNAVRQLRTRTIEGLRVDEARAKELVDASPSLIVTALSPHIGYARAAALAKRALAERRPLLDVALEEKVMPEADLRRVLDPLPMTRGGVME